MISLELAGSAGLVRCLLSVLAKQYRTGSHKKLGSASVWRFWVTHFAPFPPTPLIDYFVMDFFHFSSGDSVCVYLCVCICVCVSVFVGHVGLICNTSSATADAPLIVAIRVNERVPKVCVISYSMCRTTRFKPVALGGKGCGLKS